MNKPRTQSRIASTFRPQRTLCNLAALATLGLLTLGEPVQAAPAGTLLPANTIPVLRAGRTPTGITVRAPAAQTAPNGQAGQLLQLDQTAAKAIVEWQQFNIGRGSKVEFVQPSANSAVLNRIFDADPSIIQGQLKANGQVYLINQNGILFDRGSQIDVNTLIASTLNLSDDTFNNPGGLAAGGFSNPALFGGYDETGKTLPTIKTQRIVIGGDAGGALTGAEAPAINAAKGGAVMLFAPVIDNQTGVIQAPDGQVILAAGRRAYLQIPDVPDFQMRGMLVEIAADGDRDLNVSSLITNSGVIRSDRGNVTLAALAINQRGRISASSAMKANGSIYLQARNNPSASADFGDVQRGEAVRRGTVTLASGSVTETPLDLSDTTTLREADNYTAFRSRVRIDGASIVHQGNITSHAGEISLTAYDASNPSASRIYLDSGSLIDASGVWSDAASGSNLLTFKVTSNELKDSPDQKAGILRGATVTVDLRAGSNLLDLSGYKDSQLRTLAQKAGEAGDVKLSLVNPNDTPGTVHGSLIQRADSVVNVAGGGVRYLGGTESTTKLLGADGRLYDISTAPEALAYSSLANQSTRNYARWGYSETFQSRLLAGGVFRPTYLQGANAGSVTLDVGERSSGVVLDGRFLAGSTVGSLQRNQAPSGGTFTLGVGLPNLASPDFGTRNLTFRDPTAAATLGNDFTASAALSLEDADTLKLSTGLMSGYRSAAEGSSVSTGFGDVRVNVNGAITLPAGVAIQGSSGSALTLQADRIHLDGSVQLPGGTISLAAVATAGANQRPADALGEPSIVVGAQARLDVRGTWDNALLAGAAAARPTGDVSGLGVSRSFVNGGSIDVSGARVDLRAGSLLDASAGGAVSTRGALSGGNGGRIAIESTSADPNAKPLKLNGRYQAYGYGNGGSLALTTRSLADLDRDLTGLVEGRGFQNFNVTTVDDLVLDSATRFAPRLTTRQFVNASALQLASGSDAALASRTVTLADDLRKPVSISLASTAGQLRLEAGSRIDADPLASISLSGVDGVILDGSVRSAGGSINVRVAVPTAAVTPDFVPPQLVLGEQAVLSTAGTFVARPNVQGLLQGNLLDGGNITLNASQAQINLRAGSLIDLSGASQAIDLPAPVGSGRGFQRVVQGSNAGTLTITANDAVTLAGDLRARAGTSAANNTAGGSLAINYTRRSDASEIVGARRIVVDANAFGGVTTAPIPVNEQDPAYRDGAQAVPYKNLVLSGSAQSAAGFDKLRLRSEDEIAFVSDSNLNFSRGLTLDTKRIAVADGADVGVRGAQVKLVNTFGERIDSRAVNPTQPIADRRLAESLTEPARVQAALAGTGTFRAVADTLDLSGAVTISGVDQTTLAAAHDLRFSGRLTDTPNGRALVGSLVTTGDLTLQAAQVFPTTASRVTVSNAITQPGPNGLVLSQTDRTLTVLPAADGAAPGAVLSAGGQLTLQARRIDQNGTIKAPLGQIALQATDTLTLGNGSLTSVSADGLVIPYGQTQSGVTWTYAATGSDPLTQALTTPPSKRLDLGAKVVDVKAGSRIDVSGGGDIQAVEFVPGSGGTKDALLQPNTYAIVPAANLSSMPIDPTLAGIQNLGFDRDSAVYNSVRIGAGAAVPAGEYVLLPGYYALTPGAYMVQLLPGSTYANLQPGQTTTLQNGLTVVPGFMSAVGTDVTANRPIGVVVRPSSDIAQLSDYNLTRSAYFADLAQRNRAPLPRLPGDGGQLTLSATEQLQLDGQLLAATAAGARSASVDISASQIALVDQVGRSDIAAGFLQIDAASLSRLNASLLIGGTRSEGGSSTTGVTLTPTASQIIVANSAATTLSAPELILSATDRIDVRAGSQIASSAGSTVAQDLTVAGPGAAQGALIRVSSADAVAVNRPALVNGANAGTVQIEAGAVLSSSRALQIDATQNTVSNGRLDVAAGGALALASGRVSLGETAGLTGANASGLVLDNSQLAALNALGSLAIKSYGGIDLYGNAQVGSDQLQQLTLDSASLVGHALAVDSNVAAAPRVQAQTVSLVNRTGSTATVAGADANSKTLTVSATDITLGAGDKRISGFGAVNLAATSDLVAAGTGTLRSDAALNLSAIQVRSSAGATQTWQAINAAGVAQAVSLHSPAAAALSAADITAANARAAEALGSRLTISGSDIRGNGRVVMKSGRIELEATGSGAGDGIHLTDGSLLDAGGASKDFKGTISTANAGTVKLSAAQGTVGIAAGAVIDVSASAAGGEAGAVDVRAKSLALDGTLRGQAATPGASGQLRIDVDQLDAFSPLNSTLAAGGFQRAVDLRVRTGDLSVAAADTLRAQAITLSADAGTLTVNGMLDASALQGGGAVALYGRNVTLAAGSRIDASGTSTDVDGAGRVAAYSHGGTVAVAAMSSNDAVPTDGVLTFANGAVIDVRSGAKGDAGEVLLRAPRTATSLNATLAGQVLSQRRADSTAAKVVVEGNRVYNASATAAVGQAQFAQYGRDNQAWMTALNRAALVGTLTGDTGAALTNVHVRPAVEVRSAGDLSIVQNWDLTGSGWRIAAPGSTTTEAGSLNVRAAGDLKLVRAWLGNPDASMVSGDTWNIGLSSGADLNAADPSRVQSVAALQAQVASGRAGAGDLMLDSVRSGAAGLFNIESPASIRTGNGDVRLAAGRDFVITAAVDPLTGRFDRVDPNVLDSAPLIGTVFTTGVAAVTDTFAGAAGENRFGRNGGDITVTAQRDAIGAGDEWMTEWYRSIRQSDRKAPGQAAVPQPGDAGLFGNGVWWSYRPDFHDGVASFGGGDVSVIAGHDVNGLSAWTASSARGINGDVAPVLQTFGGGNLRVEAGNDLIAGQYMVSQGQGLLSAGGRIRSKVIQDTVQVDDLNGDGLADTQLVPSLRRTSAYVVSTTGGAADPATRLVIQAGQSVELASIDLPSSLPIYAEQTRPGNYLTSPSTPSFSQSGSLIFAPLLNHRGDSSLSVQSKSGDLSLGSTPDNWWTLAYSAYSIDPITPLIDRFPDSSLFFLPAPITLAEPKLTPSVLPPQVAITAFGGSVVASGSELLFPSTVGSLKLQAAQDIVNPRFVVSDAAPAQFDFASQVQYFKANTVTPTFEQLRDTAGQPDRLVTHASTDPFINDVVALHGSIQAPTLTFPTRSRIWAGQDISAPRLLLQNLNASDESQVVADQGSFFGSSNLASWGITGPGQLLVQAGQDIDLSKAPLKSFGNVSNPAITDPTGARLTLLAGFSGAVDLTRSDAMFKAVADAGEKQNQNAARTAIADLLPAAQVQRGDIRSFLTSIQSDAGGGIDLLAPNGDITVGLTSPPGNTTIGVVTVAGGSIRSVLSDTRRAALTPEQLAADSGPKLGGFNINRGKVLTANGGDIVIYATDGSIDAGRGAKTVVTSPPPVRKAVRDAAGNLIGYEFKLSDAVGGSGIQTAGSPAGSIFLFAPAGTIDAGEAGIKSGANISIAALTVLNADNISAAGSSAGVPVVAIGSVASTLSSSGATTSAGVTKEADSAAQSAAAAAQAAQATAFKPAILTVEVLGFGDKNCREQDRDCFAK